MTIAQEVNTILDRLPTSEQTFILEVVKRLSIGNDSNSVVRKQRETINKRQSLNEYLEAYHGKDIETVLREAEERNEKDRPIEIDWGKPVGEEVW